MARLRGLSKFGELLLDCSSTDDYSPLFQSLKDMGPSAIDLELRCLEVPVVISNISDEKEELILLKFFLRAIGQQLDKKLDYELVNAFLSLFFKIHSQTIMRTPELVEECKVLHDNLIGSLEEIGDTMNKSLCIINYLKSAVI